MLMVTTTTLEHVQPVMCLVMAVLEGRVQTAMLVLPDTTMPLAPVLLVMPLAMLEDVQEGQTLIVQLAVLHCILILEQFAILVILLAKPDVLVQEQQPIVMEICVTMVGTIMLVPARLVMLLVLNVQTELL